MYIVCSTQHTVYCQQPKYTKVRSDVNKAASRHEVFSKEVFSFWFSLFWSLPKLKIAVVSLSKMVNSGKEEILRHFLGKQLKPHFLKTVIIYRHFFVQDKPFLRLYWCPSVMVCAWVYVHRYISCISLAADGEQCHLLPLTHSPKDHRSDPRKLLCAPLRAIFLSVSYVSHRSWPWGPSFVSAGKGYLLLQILIHTRVFCYRIYKEEKSNGSSSCQHPDRMISKSIIVPAREERKNKHK